MGKNSSISWTHHTFNCWRGCTKVSAGCAHCYAETMSRRNPKILGVWGDGGTRVVASEAKWREPLAWDRAAAKAGERHRVFCASLADVFEDRPELFEPRKRLVMLIEETKNLDWLLLTKRPENACRLLQRAVSDADPFCAYWIIDKGGWGRLPPNVWLGASVEDQATADERIPHLLKLPATVHFLSMEPLLGPVDLSPWIGDLDWIICGGESGPKVPPMHPDWARSIRDQCVSSGVAYHFKQWGEWVPCEPTATRHYIDKSGRLHESDNLWMNIDLRMWQAVLRVGKKAAGRTLDGRTWDEIPEPAGVAP